jgi:protein involved in polysaccharide export with SLBB domain
MNTKIGPAIWAVARACTFALLALRAAGAESEIPAAADHGPAGLPFPLASVVGDDYPLQPLDLVVVELYNEPEATTQQRISGSGELRLPMLGSVSLRGLSVHAAEKRLEDLYRTGGFYKSPQVILYVSQHSERVISVLGQVNRPDRLQLLVGTDSMGLAQAVALAGGLTRIAKASAIQISRIGPDGRDERFVVDLNAYLNSQKSNPVADFQLQPDDVVFVPERSI